MPNKNAEQLRERTAKLKKKLAEKGATLDAPKLRTAKKKIRRLQRRRRVLDGSAQKAKKKKE